MAVHIQIRGSASGIIETIERAADEGWTSIEISAEKHRIERIEANPPYVVEVIRPFSPREWLPALANCPKLERLSIHSFGLSADEAAQLVSLPLPSLTFLDLRNNRVEDEGARALAKLSRLTTLGLATNNITNKGAQALAGLLNLRLLVLRDNFIKAEGARALARLPLLESLDLRTNFVELEGVRALARSSSLTSLDLSEFPLELEGVRALAQMNQLTSLRLDRANIDDEGARTLAAMSSLDSLSLAYNAISEVGVAALSSLERLEYLDVRGNGHFGVDLALAQPVATRSARAIFTATRRLTGPAPTAPLNEAKLIVLGNEAVGKTSLIRYLVQGKARDPDEQKTVGIHAEKIETRPWSPAGVGPQLNVWDFGGQEIMHQTHKFFLTERSIYLLVLEDRREDDVSVFTWLRTIANRSGDSPILIVINKCDGGSERLRLDGTSLFREWPALVAILRTSCLADEYARGSIDALRRRIVDILNTHPRLQHVRDPFPTPWRRVKDELATRTQQHKILQRRDFERLCEQAEPELAITSPDEQELLLRLLHDLGVVVAHGQQTLSLLDPNWLTEAIYKLLMSGLIAQHGGVFSRARLGEVLDPNEYSGKRGEFVLSMMAHRDVGLCFPLPDSEGEEFLIPEALPVREPYVGPWGDDLLRFRYKYGHLPRGLVPRLIVEAHDKLAARGARWRTGVVLEVHECRVLVRADMEGKTIDIMVDGPQAMRRSALNYVRDKFERVHRLNPEAKPEERVPLPDEPESDVSYEYLRKLEELKTESFLPERGNRSYTIAELLDAVRRPPREASAEDDERREPQRSHHPMHKSAWILVISDLHVDATTDIDTMRQTLVEDLRSGPSGGEALAALVVAGDLTNRASKEEFERATDLILGLADMVGKPSPSLVVIPGNHDLDWSHEGVYRVHKGARPSHLSDAEFIESGKIKLVRDDAKYRESFGNFSKYAYERISGHPYPLDPAQQVEVFDLERLGVTFVTFNSAWNTAEYSPEAAMIHNGAVNVASRELMRVPADRLKIAVWHHPISGNEKIRDDAFVERLRTMGIRLCLHGHIHESRTDLLNYLHPRQIHVVGTGSFGAPWQHRVESTPRLYQLLELRPDRRSIRVHTRGLDKAGGAWGPRYEWPNPVDASARLPYFDIPL